MQFLLSWCLQSKSRNRHANKCTIQYSKVLPWRYLQSAVGIWKREKAHLPGGDEGQLHRGGRQRAATGPVLENRPCGQQAEGTTGAETEAQAALRRSR